MLRYNLRYKLYGLALVILLAVVAGATYFTYKAKIIGVLDPRTSPNPTQPAPPPFALSSNKWQFYDKPTDLPLFSFSLFSLPSQSQTKPDSHDLTLDDWRGRPIMLNFWALWCVPCRKELPSLNQLASTYAPQGLAIIALDVDLPFNAEKSLALWQQLGLTELDLAVAKEDDNPSSVWQRFAVQVLPTTLLINREGKLIARLRGDIDWQSAEAKLMMAWFLGN